MNIAIPGPILTKHYQECVIGKTDQLIAKHHGDMVGNTYTSGVFFGFSLVMAAVLSGKFGAGVCNLNDKKEKLAISTGNVKLIAQEIEQRQPSLQV